MNLTAKRSRNARLSCVHGPANTGHPMGEPGLFQLRIWRQLAGGFHASAQRVDDEQTHHVARPDEMARFLTDTALSGANPDDNKQCGNPSAPTID